LARWFPVARSAEIAPRHVAQAQLLGREIALWRSDAGAVNAWENRCPHRGVRLSIGYNMGNELRCQYHGWRFAAGSGQCTLIPAHPTQKPASGIRVGVYAVVERYHLVWVNLDAQVGAEDGAGAAVPTPIPTAASEFELGGVAESPQDTTLRSIFVNAPVEVVSGALLEGYRVDAATTAPVAAIDAYTLTAAGAQAAVDAAAITFLLQPVSDQQTVIHGLLQPDALATERLAVLRYHNAELSRLRDGVEGVQLRRTRDEVEGPRSGRMGDGVEGAQSSQSRDEAEAGSRGS
jgi:nitrite reductase/ring-hydroxylating ferredoxin subunit